MCPLVPTSRADRANLPTCPTRRRDSCAAITKRPVINSQWTLEGLGGAHVDHVGHRATDATRTDRARCDYGRTDGNLRRAGRDRGGAVRDGRADRAVPDNPAAGPVPPGVRLPAGHEMPRVEGVQA